MALAVGSQPTVPTTAAAATLRGKTLLTGSTGLTIGSCVAYTTSTIIAPVLVWPLFTNTVAIDIVGTYMTNGNLQGAFGFAPGTLAVIGAMAAVGVTVNIGLTWKEVPVDL